MEFDQDDKNGDDDCCDGNKENFHDYDCLLKFLIVNLLKEFEFDKEKFTQIYLCSTFNYPHYHGGDDDQDQDVKKL